MRFLLLSKCFGFIADVEKFRAFRREFGVVGVNWSMDLNYAFWLCDDGSIVVTNRKVGFVK